jgi:hypothetical protein
MAGKVKVWFDPEGDYLEVQFSDAPGFMRPTAHAALMERVDQQGQVLGFSVLGVSHFRKGHPLEVELMTGK